MFGKKRLTWVVLAIFLTADVALFLSVVFAPPAPSNPNFAATAQYLEQNPALKPGFIADNSTQSTSTFDLRQTIMVSIKQEPFVRQGISSDQISNQITKNHRLLIDGNPVTTSSVEFQVAFCDPSDPKLCWGSPIEIYFNASELSAGLHLATITIPDFDGAEHSYSWAFRYDPTAPTSDPNVMPTLAVLPTVTPAN
jgi:hypothetical protein